jgi:hypothetical protein
VALRYILRVYSLVGRLRFVLGPVFTAASNYAKVAQLHPSLARVVEWYTH